MLYPKLLKGVIKRVSHMAQPAIGKSKTDWKRLLKDRKTIHKIPKPCRPDGNIRYGQSIYSITVRSGIS